MRKEHAAVSAIIALEFWTTIFRNGLACFLSSRRVVECRLETKNKDHGRAARPRWQLLEISAFHPRNSLIVSYKYDRKSRHRQIQLIGRANKMKNERAKHYCQWKIPSLLSSDTRCFIGDSMRSRSLHTHAKLQIIAQKKNSSIMFVNYKEELKKYQ